MAAKGLREMEEISGSLNAGHFGTLDTATSLSSLIRLLFKGGPDVSSMTFFGQITGVRNGFMGMLIVSYALLIHST